MCFYLLREDSVFVQSVDGKAEGEGEGEAEADQSNKNIDSFAVSSTLHC